MEGLKSFHADANIIPVAQDTIDRLGKELRRGHDEALIEVHRLRDEAVEVGRQIGRCEGILQVNEWLNDLKSLYHRARKLTATSLYLATLFAEEADRLSRQDEASRLRALYFSIRREFDCAKYIESSASYAHSQVNLEFSLGRLAVGSIIKLVSKNELLLAISDSLLRNPGDEQPPFGTVLVCIGPKGLPDDVGVASISHLARESNRRESEVMNRLRESGHLLLGEDAFSLLVHRLIDDVREGRLLLPVSREKLSEITASSLIKLEAENQQ